MKTRAMFLLVGLLFTSAFGLPTLHDSTSQLATIDSLKNKIDQINTKVDKIIEEIETHQSPMLLNTKTDNWGKGWSVGANFYYPVPEIEFGYTLEEKKNISIGAYLGYGLKLFDQNSDPGLLYLKLLFGTPIFFNTVSIQAFISPSYYLTKDFGGGTNSTFGTGIGGQLVFWLAPQGCITLGTKAQISNRTAKTWDNTALLGGWTMYRIGTLGITFFIQ
jgi:hypothetical protein